MSGDSIELNQVRKRLTEVLGDNATLYFQHLRNWFTKKCTKEEFDFQVCFRFLGSMLQRSRSIYFFVFNLIIMFYFVT